AHCLPLPPILIKSRFDVTVEQFSALSRTLADNMLEFLVGCHQIYTHILVSRHEFPHPAVHFLHFFCLTDTLTVWRVGKQLYLVMRYREVMDIRNCELDVILQPYFHYIRLCDLYHMRIDISGTDDDFFIVERLFLKFHPYFFPQLFRYDIPALTVKSTVCTGCDVQCNQCRFNSNRS